MALIVWYLVKSDLSGVDYFTVAYTWQENQPAAVAANFVYSDFGTETYENIWKMEEVQWYTPLNQGHNSTFIKGDSLVTPPPQTFWFHVDIWINQWAS